MGILTSCKKDTVMPELNTQTQVSQTKMLWVTPTGITIPYEESHRWEEFVAEHFSQTKNDPTKKKYVTLSCTTPTINCGLKCIENTVTNDCSGLMECLPCANCPCTQ